MNSLYRQSSGPEFKNNGLVDSLTHAPAPAIFFDNLAREYASATRENRTLSILSIQSSSHEVVTEAQLIALARTITRHIRSEEFFCRISETGFWIAVRGGTDAAGKLAMRIIDDEDKKWRTSMIQCTPHQTFDEWIRTADQHHFL